jgi:uncharacterized protein (DUF697 family)
MVEPASEQPHVKEIDQAQAAALKADNIIKNHIIGAMGAGLVPFPVVDMVAVALIEVNMIAELAAAYNFPVPRRLVVYKLLISLAGGIGPAYLSIHFQNVVKVLPLVGHAIYVGALSLSGGISVYAVGKIFQKHFESGGTFLSSKNTVLRQYFAEKQNEGRTVVPAMIAGTTTRASS